MEAIRTKDKVFLAVAIPLALAAAYVYFWRTDAVKKFEALRAESATLVQVEDFEFEKTAAARRLKKAEETLAAEKGIPIPPAKVKANAADGIAARELAILEIFRAHGLAVGASQAVEAKNPANADALRATGARPAPTLRAYELTGHYASVVAALRTVAVREMAVVPETVEMTKPGIWRVALWL